MNRCLPWKGWPEGGERRDCMPILLRKYATPEIARHPLAQKLREGEFVNTVRIAATLPHDDGPFTWPSLRLPVEAIAVVCQPPWQKPVRFRIEWKGVVFFFQIKQVLAHQSVCFQLATGVFEQVEVQVPGKWIGHHHK